MIIDGPYYVRDNRRLSSSTGRYDFFGAAGEGIILHWRGWGESWDLYKPYPPENNYELYCLIDGQKWHLHSGRSTWANGRDAQTWLDTQTPADAQHFL